MRLPGRSFHWRVYRRQEVSSSAPRGPQLKDWEQMIPSERCNSLPLDRELLLRSRTSLASLPGKCCPWP
eukprot:symbB.v1.2.011570.t1/scaffold781.1/size163279/4